MTSRARHALALVAAAVLALSAQRAGAGERLVLVELFTSQGCSSCPPADRLLAGLADRDDVLPLSLHVDYWDYLGWRDTFGLPEATARQKSYRDAWDARFVYTPQIVVDGAVEVRGPSAAPLDAAIAAAGESAPTASIEIVEARGGLVAAVSDAPGRATVWLARYSPAETVAIERGENAGREITYRNVVRALGPLGRVDEIPPGGLALPPAPGEGIAVWIQDGEGGPVLAAARREPRP